MFFWGIFNFLELWIVIFRFFFFLIISLVVLNNVNLNLKKNGFDFEICEIMVYF